MQNTRVSDARARVKWVAVLAALGFLLITAITGYFYQHPQSKEAPGKCSGYAGQPLHAYLPGGDDNARAYTECRQAIPTLKISVKNRHFISLQKNRLEAMEKGVLISGGNDLMPAHFSFKGKTVSGKVRLKGDWTVHLQENKSWSLRIILSGDDDILGRRRFSLQVPKVRNYDVELLYTYQLEQAGLMPVRSRFVEVEFNGESWGLMAIEDHFSKELMEVHKRKESVIGRFDESDMWAHRSENDDHGVYDSVHISEFNLFNENKVRKSESLNHYGTLAASMMAAWQEGRLALHQILDLEQYMRFIVVTEAWGGWHAFRWHNLRLYLNPYTLKFEPVPYDNGTPLVDISRYVAYLLVTPNSTAHSINMPPLEELFESPRANAVLAAELLDLYEELGVPEGFPALRKEHAFIKRVFKAHDMPATVNLEQLEKNFSFLHSSHEQYFRKREQEEPEPENPQERQYTSFVRVHIYDNGVISLANKMPFEVALKDIRLVSPYGVKRSLRESISLPSRLPATALRQRPDIIFLEAVDIDPDAIVEVTVENPNTGQILKQRERRRLRYLDEEHYLSLSPGLAPASTPPPWVRVNDGQWTIPAGNWSVTRALIVPAGVTLTLEAGAHLEMASQAYILARGPLNISGNEEHPVTIEGVGEALWGGIYVLHADEASSWEHAVIRNARPFAVAQLQLTGATNFYQSDVSLQNVLIENIPAEDAINVIESRFLFDQITVRHSRSDGLDSDYSSGRIKNSTFTDIGGDAIDTSGSLVEVSGVRLSTIRDKGVSAGEASSLTLDTLDIDSVGVGIAAKDYSRVDAKNIRVRQTALAAMMAYSKKPEYGGAHIEVHDIEYDHSADIAIRQFGSMLIVDDAEVPAKNVNVDYLYGEGLMKK